MRLEATRLQFGYASGQMVLKDVTFSYESPGALCILGHNGTGKSTLLQCLTGANKLVSGSVRIDGLFVGEYKANELAKKVAYLPQSTYPAFAFSVIDVVMMGCTSRMGRFNSPGYAEKLLALEKLRFLGIEHLSDKSIKGISGGERQLVMIASALAQEPELIIMDEPTSHLDFGNQFKFIQLVQKLQKLGIGVLMATHFPDQALYLNCPTAILDEGRICAMGPAKKVITQESLSALYGVDVEVTEIHGRPVCVPFGITKKV